MELLPFIANNDFFSPFKATIFDETRFNIKNNTIFQYNLHDN